MSDLIDISVPVYEGMPVWPGNAGYQRRWHKQIGPGNHANISTITTDVHTGTHVDAPLHFVAGASTIEQMPLEVLVGPAVVADLPAVEAVTANDLDELSLPVDTTRLLLRTRNSKLWQQSHQPFTKDFVALTADAAQWVVDHNIRLIGVDYLSVQRFYDGPETHQILLGAGVVIVEGLDLFHVAAGEYELMCLPLKLIEAEGAPARAVLRPL